MGVPSQKEKEDGPKKGPVSLSQQFQTTIPGPAARCFICYTSECMDTASEDGCPENWARFPHETQAAEVGVFQVPPGELLCEQSSGKPSLKV